MSQRWRWPKTCQVHSLAHMDRLGLPIQQLAITDRYDAPRDVGIPKQFWVLNSFAPFLFQFELDWACFIVPFLGSLFFWCLFLSVEDALA